MNWFRQVLHAKSNLQRLSEEIEQHLTEKVEALMDFGMSPPAGRTSRPTRVRQCSQSERARPRNLDVATHREHARRYRLRHPQAAKISRIHLHRHRHARPWHRHERRRLQRPQRSHSPSIGRCLNRRISFRSFTATVRTVGLHSPIATISTTATATYLSPD